MQTIYAYSYNPAIATGTNTTGTNWRMAYQQPIMLYKGTANTIKLVVFTTNQRVVNLTDYDVQVQIVDRETEEHYVTRTATITTPASGVASVTFTEEDLRDLQHRFYHIIARLVDPDDGSSVVSGEILYLDDNYGAFTPVTIENAWNYSPTSISTTDGIQDISFTNIGETPDSYSGFGKNYLRVNNATTGIEFASFATFDGNIIPNTNNTLNLGAGGNRWGNVHANRVNVGNIDIYNNIIETNGDVINVVARTQTMSWDDNSTDPEHNEGDGGFLAFNDDTHTADGPKLEIWYGNVSRPSDPAGQHSLDIHAAANSYVEFASYDLETFMGIDSNGGFIQTDWSGDTKEWRFQSSGILSMPNGAIIVDHIGNTQIYMPGDTIQFLFKQPDDSYRTHSFDISGKVSIDGDLVPNANVTYSLGSPSEQWSDLYVSNSTIYMGGIPLSIDAGGNLLINGNAVTGGGNPFNQDLDTTDSPNFVNLGLSGTAGAGYATLSVTVDRDFVIGLNDTSTGAKTFEFSRDGSLIVPGKLTVDDNISGGAGDRLYLGGEDAEGTAWIEIPNVTRSATLPIDISNPNGGGVNVTTGAGNWLFDDTRFLHFPSSTDDDYNIGESIDGFNVRSDLSFGIATNFTTNAKYWLFDTDGSLTIPGDIKSEDAINVDINLSDSTLRRWTFGADGILDIPGGIKTSGFTIDLSTYRGIEDAGLGDYTITIDGNTIRSDRSSISLLTPNSYGIVVDENNKQVLVGGLDGEGTINLLFGSESITGENYDAQLQMTDVGAPGTPSSFSITTQGDTNVWTFGGDGSLTVPGLITGSDGLLYLGYDLFATPNIYIGASGNGKVIRLESDRLQVLSNPPTTSKGISGDDVGMVAFDSNYTYYCTAAYTNGIADIWKRVAWSGDTW